MRARPFLWIALAMMSGIMLAEWKWFEASFLIAMIATIVCAAFIINRILCQVILFGILIMSAGATMHHFRTAILSEKDLRFLIGEEAILASFEGTICQRPALRASEREGQIFFQSRLILQTQRLRFGNHWQNCEGKILLQIDENLRADVFEGSVLQVMGKVAKPASPDVFGGFDYRNFLRLKGIHYEIRLKNWEAVRLKQKAKAPPIPARFQKWAQSAVAIGQPEDQAIKLIWAMLLGWRTWLGGEIREPFIHSGTMHVFAISGLHIALIAGLLIVFTKCIGIPRRLAGYFVIPSLWLYTMATGCPASAVRASCVSTIILLGWMLSRPPDALNSIGAAVLIILIWDPLQLFQAGFQLSFTIATTLILLYPRLLQIAQRLFGKDPFILIENLPLHRRIAEHLREWFLSAFSISLAAWLGSIPLIAFYFNLISPIALLANLVLVPLAGLTLSSAVMGLMMATGLPTLAVIANSSAWFWMRAMMTTSQSFAAIPFSYAAIPSPPAIVCAGYYLGLILFARSIRFRIFGCVFAMASIGIWMGFEWFESLGRTRITFLPVHSGEAIFIDHPGNQEDWMIDGGPLWSASWLVEPFLKRGEGKFRNVLLTHGDKEHIEALTLRKDEHPPLRFVMSSLRFRSKFYRELIGDLQNAGHEIEKISAPKTLGKWNVLLPLPDSSASRADDGAIVMLGEIEGFRILLLSDLGRSVQRTLLDLYPDLKVDVISINLPKPLQSANRYVLSQLHPQVIIVSGGNRWMGNRWVRDLENAFPVGKPHILFTGKHGSIRIEISDKGGFVETRDGNKIELIPKD